MSQHTDGLGGGIKLLIGLSIAALAVMGHSSWKLTRSIDAVSAALLPKPLSAAELKAKEAQRAKEVEASIAALKRINDYETARWHPLHFKPGIATASNEECLTCHQEILKVKVRPVSPAGLKAADSVAWYQTLDTYSGEQMTFHARHLASPFAQKVMNLSCSFCHQGHDPREEAPGASATASESNFALRKVVNPTDSCLMCHGSFPYQYMEGLDQPWHKIRENFDNPEAPNGCLACHSEQFRTVRHQVNYLKAGAIEEDAKKNADTCYGCHGGRAWYRTTYPYPRHPWPGMDNANVPAWAKTRPGQSKPEHQLAGK